ncbi:GNAT family N-acetyltransferase [Macrococcoides caseolyticum]|uniref:GNAT family N-acetyltransferase n=1 Tax=Macrococcoides caseolyticum TaxID=69966 RepID=UPI000C33C725|nr:GNAT family protein [Macrococcus caseolyticus]PKF32495.1 GNAT family N-acetyltransferase [Macrococcus caseolyticus]
MSNFLNKPTLTEGDIRLRPFQRKDGKRMIQILNDPEVLRLTGSVNSSEEANHPSFLHSEIEDWYSSLAVADNRLDLAIEYKDKLIGEVVLNEYDEVKAEANFRVLMDTNYTSKGIGNKSITLFLDYACRHLPIRRFVLGVYVFNDRARYVYEKVGFTFHHRQEEAYSFDGQSYAMDHYELINPHYANPS